MLRFGLGLVGVVVVYPLIKHRVYFFCVFGFQCVFFKTYAFGGFVKGVASQKGIKIRWGGDWDSDNDLHDQNFIDLPHFELAS